MLRIVRWIALIATIVSMIVCVLYLTIIRLAAPSLTLTQAALLTWPAFIPVAVSALVLALVAYLEKVR